ncbi:hypothetical protein D3C78_1483900 [compost metagenome]
MLARPVPLPSVAPVTVTVLPAPAFWSLKVPDWPDNTRVSLPTRPFKVPPLRLATVVPS